MAAYLRDMTIKRGCDGGLSGPTGTDGKDFSCWFFVRFMGALSLRANRDIRVIRVELD